MWGLTVGMCVQSSDDYESMLTNPKNTYPLTRRDVSRLLDENIRNQKGRIRDFKTFVLWRRATQGINDPKEAGEILGRYRDGILEAQYKLKTLERAKYDLQRGMKTDEALKSVQKNLPKAKRLSRMNRFYIPATGSTERVFTEPESYLPRTEPTWYERMRGNYRNFVARMRAPEEEARERGVEVPYRTGWRSLVPSFVPQWKSPERKALEAQDISDMQERGTLWGN